MHNEQDADFGLLPAGVRSGWVETRGSGWAVKGGVKVDHCGGAKLDQQNWL